MRRSGLPGAQQMRLPDELIERRRPHAIRERTHALVQSLRVQASTRCAQPPSHASASDQPADDAQAVGDDVAQVRLATDVHRALRHSITMPMTSSATPIIG